MAEDPNVFTTTWEHDAGAIRGTRVGAAAGASELGCTLVELDPGGQAAPYHLHHGNEELLIVLSGTVELRTPAGTRALAAGAVAAFPAGRSGAHRVRNVSSEPARYLMVSTMRFPDVAEHVDTGTVLALRGPIEGSAYPSGAEGDIGALVRAAIEAEAR